MEIFLIAKYFLILLLAYILGSLSLGFFLAKIKGIDLRKEGPIKNIGTSNVRHVLGLKYAIPTALWDFSKGIIAVIIAITFNLPIILVCLSGLFAIIGHCFPFYLKFKGGRGAATAIGLIFFGFISIILTSFNKVILPIIIISLLSLGFFIFTKGKNLTAIFSTILAILFFPKISSNILILYTGLLWLSLLGIIAIKGKGLRA
ncbi:MAG: glycerol-3-phosphate acyltransferase [Candidatus Pacearchaeota archaeon]